jgi:DNA-binding CsgD family transcriptional regulator
VYTPSLQPLAESEWQRLVQTGVASGEREFVRGDGLRIGFEYAAQPELITGRHLVLVVALRVEMDNEPEELARASPSDGPITPREREIVELLAQGKSNEDIAQQLYVLPQTVHTHVRNAKTKTGVRNRAHLVAFALGQGLLAHDNSQQEA